MNNTPAPPTGQGLQGVNPEFADLAEALSEHHTATGDTGPVHSNEPLPPIAQRDIMQIVEVGTQMALAMSYMGDTDGVKAFMTKVRAIINGTVFTDDSVRKNVETAYTNLANQLGIQF